VPLLGVCVGGGGGGGGWCFFLYWVFFLLLLFLNEMIRSCPVCSRKNYSLFLFEIWTGHMHIYSNLFLKQCH
jgi:hypothetical protein